MDDEILQKVREILGEHCPAWVIACEDADGVFWQDYSTPITAKGLHDYASKEINNLLEYDSLDYEYEEADDDDGDEWKHNL